ncbi:PAS domain-containing protein [uncultured Roseobacter sp.]|uniref:PAS domain-containing protein n=1 Tax=uncultured Roseobacter sp. TaxID=114847 RepID=UPI0026140E24|nr:PAS domain-containing protein [uncultured Roseobacter sp.]
MAADTVDKDLVEDLAFEGFSRTQVSMVVTNPHLEDNPIVYVNHAFTRQTGFARSAAIGRNCRFLQGEETDKAAVDLIRRGIEARESVSTDILNYRANGEPFLNRLVIAPICDDAGEVQYFVGVQKELRQEERGNAPEKINAQLTEIQDRVETDMSMIIGMIRHQSNSTSVPAEYAALSRRIETLQLLYEEMKLSDQHSNRDHIQMASYLSRLCCAIGHVYGRSGIRLNMQIDPLEVPIETASRVGLVVSEVLTNAFMHAFERIDTGLVEVRMSQLSAGGLRVTVSDDGVGIPQTMSWPNPSTVGGRIVNGLIEGLEGTLQLGRGAAGSFVTIDVPAGASITE